MMVVARSEWGARAPKEAAPRLSTDLVTIHWEGPTMGRFLHAKCPGKVRAIQAYHMAEKPRGRDWNDIAYSAIVCPHGYIFEGRGRGRRTGANGTDEGNDGAYALCALIGEGDRITDGLLEGLADGVRWLGGRRVNCHRDWKPTECPGDALVAHARAGRFTPSANPIPQPLEDDDMTPAQEAKVDRLLASNTRIERNLRTLAGALAKVEGIVQSDFEAQLVDIAEQRDRASDNDPGA